MSEKDKNNDPIERFFRKKADEYDIQYKEEDWLKLEKRLDKKDLQLFNRRRRRLAAAAVLLLFGILAYFTYDQQLKINQLNERLSSSENTTNVPIPDINPEFIPDNSAADDDSESNPDSPLAQDNIESEANNELPVAATDDSSEEKITEEDQRSSFSGFTEISLAVTTVQASPGFDGLPHPISAIKPAKINQSQSSNEEVKANRQSSTSSNTRGFNAQQKGHTFSLGLMAGPDMSTVGSISSFADPGHKIGFSFEYNITPDLSISTGLQRTSVKYVAQGSEYKLPDGYLPYDAAPGEIAAQCILVDIPVSIKYNFLHFDNSRIFATAGLSSYIMLDEDYQFNYENQQPDFPERWHQRTGTRHWMSNGTFSVGYELDVMQNISIRAEPFIKVPLKEVGWGNVDLYSMGTFVSLNYKW